MCVCVTLSQAYEHTLTSLKEAVEEADVARQIQEVQQVEMAEVGGAMVHKHTHTHARALQAKHR